MNENWIRKEATEDNDAIIDLIDDVDMYEYICNDGEDYYMVEPNEWEKAYKDLQNGRNREKERQIEHELWERITNLIGKGCEALARKDIEEAIVLFEESVSLKSKSIYPYCELSRIYKKRHDAENELRICKIASERFPTSLQYSKRIRELEGTQPEIKAPCKRQKTTIEGVSFGDKFYNLWNSFTEDDFYVQDVYVEEELEEGIYSESNILENSINIYKSRDNDWLPQLDLKEDRRASLIDYYNYMYNASKPAKEAVAMNDYCLAIDIYERLLAEEIPCYDYYESLRELYQKFRLRNAELEMLKDVMVLVEKDAIRYNRLTNKIKSWFPNTDISENSPSVGHGMYIYRQKPWQIKKWEERIIWLEERVNKKNKK